MSCRLKAPLFSFILSPYWVLLVGIMVRFIYALQYSHTPFWLATSWDSEEYYRMALALSHRQGDIGWHYRPPLYPFLISLMFIFLGPGLTPVYLCQSILGLVNALLVRRMAAIIFSPWAGALAGTLMAASGVGIHLEFQVLPTITAITLTLLSLNQLITKSGNGSLQPIRLTSPCLLKKMPGEMLAGLWGGLSSLTWPLMVVIYPVGLYLLPRRGWLCFSAGFALPLGLNLFIHLLINSGPVLLSAQGGVNFYIGNSPSSQGFTAYLPGVGPGWDWTTVEGLAQVEKGGDLTPYQVDRHFWMKGWEVIKSDPRGWAKLIVRKAGLFWSTVEISNTQDIYHLADRCPILKYLIPIGVPYLLPLTLLGCWMGRRKREVQGMALYGGGFYIGSLLFFINYRFRYPIFPLMAIMVSGGIVGLAGGFPEWWGGFRLKRVLIPLSLLIVGFGLPFSAKVGYDPSLREYGFFTEGVAWEKLGELKRAREAYEEAIKRQPAIPYAHLSLARIALQEGERERALSHLRQELINLPTNGRAWMLLGELLEERGEYEQALTCYRRALEHRPELKPIVPRARRLIKIISQRGPGSLPIGMDLSSWDEWFQLREK